MAQTTAAVANACAKVWISTNGTTFTDISGVTQSVQDTEQTRMSGEAYTLDGEGPIVKRGKKEPMETTVTIIYTETDAEAYEQVRIQFEQSGCNVPFYLRYSPRGGLADNEQLTTGEGILTAFTYPALDASSAAPIVAGFKIKHPGFTTTIIAS